MRTVLAVFLVLVACGPTPDETSRQAPREGSSPCTAFDPEISASQDTFPSVGSAAGWSINGNAGLACSEPGAEGAVGCELAPGGSVIASKGEAAYGFRNDTAAPLSISVNTEGMTCDPLKIPA
jgi:hypothetical protein